ncbi:hypothetical protein PsYK624_098170 [Phanerochaete sordida]|uniref:ABM domain-containing protein n=1 Tax=Phanerochaete sordida TaxID=48140 RepID=A0A9P3LH19_9APHY|nr:hypothetical protein PsYK624_098170 [Phanerochaete sordida]
MVSSTSTTVLEILSFPASDLFKNHISIVDDALQVISTAAGSRQAYRGREVEDNDIGYVLQVWDSLEHHRTFARSAGFTTMRKEFEKCIDHDKPQQSAVVHVPFDPNSTAIQQPALVFIYGRVKSRGTKAKLEMKIAEVSRNLEGLAFGGPTLEDPDVYYLILGARTIEMQDAQGTGMKLLEELGEYIHAERRHAWMKPFAGLDHTKD